MRTNVGVMGAGAIGCYIGGRLIAAQVPTVLIARPSLIAEIRDYGLNISDNRSEPIRLEPDRVEISDRAEALRDCNPILLTVKCGDTARAAEMLKPVTDDKTVIVSIQNGVSNIDVLREALPDRRVVAGMVEFNVRRDDGARFHRGSRGSLAFQRSPDTSMVRAALVRAGLRAKIYPDIRRLQWGKLLMNLGNSINALAGCPIVEMLRTRDYRLVIAACVREGLAALSRTGVRPKLVLPLPLRAVPALLSMPSLVFASVARPLMAFDRNARSSMADDLLRGRTTEIDYLNGEIIRLAGRHGLEAPVNEVVLRLVKEAEVGGAPALSGPELRRAVGV